MVSEVNVIKKDFVSILFGTRYFRRGGGGVWRNALSGARTGEKVLHKLLTLLSGAGRFSGNFTVYPYISSYFLVQLCKIHPASTYLIKNYG